MVTTKERECGVPISRRGWAGWASLLALLNVAGILPWLLWRYVCVDLAETVYHVKELGIGRVPYRDIVSHHFLGYLIPLRIVDLLVPLDRPYVLWALAYLFNGLSAVFAAAAAAEVAGAGAALSAAALMVSVGWFPYWQGFSFNFQSYIVPILFALVWALLRARRVGSRAALLWASGLAGYLLINDQRLIVLPVLLAMTVAATPALRNAGTLLFALLWYLAAPFLALSYLWANGALDDFVTQTVMYPLYLRNHGNTEGGLVNFLRFTSGRMELEAPAVAIALFALVAAGRARRFRFFGALMAALLVLDLLYAASGGRPFANYYYVFAVPVVLLAAALPWLMTAGHLRRLAVTATAMLVTLSALGPVLQYARADFLFVPPQEEIAQQSGEFVRAHSAEWDQILVWGYQPQVYLMSGRFSPFRDMGLIFVVGANFDSTNADEQGVVPEMGSEFRSMLERNAPKVFIYYRIKRLDCLGCFGKGPVQTNMDFHSLPQLAFLKEVVARRYRLAQTFENEFDRAEVFVRDDNG